MSDTYPYPIQEHYDFPKDQTEQAEEELRYYPTQEEMLLNISALNEMYGSTPFMRAMKKYADIAKSLRISGSDFDRQSNESNDDFYNGTLLSTHVNVAPARSVVRRTVLRTNPLAGFDESPEKAFIAKNIEDYLQEWVSGDTYNWHDFLESQDEQYKDVVVRLALRMYEGEEFSEEKELDFLAGLTFATNIVRQAVMVAQTSNPM